MAWQESDPAVGGDISSYAMRIVDDFQSEYEPTLEVLQRLVGELPSLQSSSDPLLDPNKLEYAAKILRGAFRQLGWQNAVEFLKSIPASVLEERIWVSYYLADTDGENHLALYSRKELANLIEKFLTFLESEHQQILETGLPAHRFRECLWLERLLAKTYPVRCVCDNVPFDELGGNTSVYIWVRKTLDEDGIGFTRIPCQQQDATLVEGLSQEDAESLAEIRENVFTAKTKILVAAKTCLGTGDIDSFWEMSMASLSDSLTGEQAEFLIKVDRIYTTVPAGGKLDPTVWNMYGYDGPIQPGGFTNIVEFVGHVWKECSIGTMHKTRELLADLLVSDEENDPRLDCVNPWPYFEVLGTENQSVLENAISVFIECDLQESIFWKDFDSCLARCLKTEFEDEVVLTVRVHRRYLQEFKLNVETYVDWARSHFETSGSFPELRLSPASSPKRGTEKALVKFPSPVNLKWNEVTIEFVSNESIKITAKGVSKTYTFAEVGFKDDRKGDRPNTRWGFFKKLAENSGKLDWDTTNIDEKDRNRAQKAIQDISDRLKLVMGITERPFQNYRKNKAYVTEFTLLDSSHSPQDGSSD